MLKICPVCGARFERGDTARKFCSKECAKQDQNRRQREGRRLRRETRQGLERAEVLVSAPYEEAVVVTASVLLPPPAPPRPVKSCCRCGRSYRDGYGRYCSIDCIVREVVRKPVHPTRAAFTTAKRNEIWTRDEGLCVLCGAPGAHVHHIVPVSHGGDNHEDNLVTVCLACHMEFHPFMKGAA